MEGKRTTQYLGALAGESRVLYFASPHAYICVYNVLMFPACLSAMAVGSTMGWTSAAGSLTDTKRDFHISKDEFAWVGAFISIGAIFGAIPLGLLANLVGRKMTLIGLAPFMTLGYVLLAVAKSVSIALILILLSLVF